MSAVPVLGSAGNPGPQNPESKAKTNLIVNYLPHSMNEEEVKNLFSAVGKVQSCKLIKDKLTQTSLGYAFVNYYNAEDAEKAIQNLNGLPLQAKTVKVSYARPSSASIKNANLYVAHLPNAYTTVELEALFRPFGNIITSRVLADTTTGDSRGVGFVRFDKHTEAETAISALNGQTLPHSSQPLLVKFANQPKMGQLPSASAGASGISSYAASLTRRGVGNSFPGTGGPIRHSVTSVRYNPVSTLVATAASQALSQLPGGAAASLQLPTNPQTWCIFVYNLPESTEDSLLYQLFSPFGAISSVKVIRDVSTNKCKRYGFVNMMNYEEAYAAILHLNGHMCEGKPLQVSFKVPKST